MTTEMNEYLQAGKCLSKLNNKYGMKEIISMQ